MMTGSDGQVDDIDEVLTQIVGILDALAIDDTRGRSMAELRIATGLPERTARDLLARLQRLGLVGTDGSTFHLGLRLFELGGSAPIPRALREAAIPFMGDLYEATHETIHFGILSGADVVYIAKLRGHDPARVTTTAGVRMPASCTALGKAILAYSPPEVVAEALAHDLPARTPASITSRDDFSEELRAIATRGVAYDREENEVGVTCVAAPVLDPDLVAVGALSITGPVHRFDPELAAAAVLTAARGLYGVLFNR
jgi:DNA-binding IclR family transcriptional regulator